MLYDSLCFMGLRCWVVFKTWKLVDSSAKLRSLYGAHEKSCDLFLVFSSNVCMWWSKNFKFQVGNMNFVVYLIWEIYRFRFILVCISFLDFGVGWPKLNSINRVHLYILFSIAPSSDEDFTWTEFILQKFRGWAFFMW